MSGKLSIYDAFITVGAFILVLGLYQHVKPLLTTRAYPVFEEDEPPIPVVNASRYDPPTNYTNNPNRPRPIAYKDCVRGGGHPKCCDAALHGGITQDEFDNCHLCNHPDCSGGQFDTSKNTAAGIKDNPVDAGFQLGKWTVPIQDVGYKDSNYAYAYRVTYV